MSAIAGSITYRVLFADSKGADHVAKVVIIDGYSTIDDIEKILRNTGRDVAKLKAAMCAATNQIIHF